MKQGGLILALGCVHSNKKQNKTKNSQKIRRTETHHES